ncbi:hypothetical protein HN51_028973 [Arachis hypogaea]|uniref:Uncharacterized protein n=1 Tax=Arachis hypogaea TaxID=3818 RepID=A0A445BGH8_ARAHY|nr:uncharacterized protein DS421_9g275990 [Arachis hypogaea]RYR37731.1 hypothetical protein Ahy_A09g042609 [Arachis hypogaea]
MRMNINFGSDHDQHLLESGLLKTNYGDMCDNYFGFRTEAGKSADPRIMRLLEFIRELYIRRRETFKKMVPERLHEDLVGLFERISTLLTGANKSMHGARTLQRSLSAGSSQLKLDRFRVRAVDVTGAAGGGGAAGEVQSGQGGQGDNKPAGSK